MVLIVFNCFGQDDLLKQKDYADSIFKAQNYFDAIKEYKRLMFFDKQDNFSFYAYNQIAKCYKYGGKFEKASEYFSLALLKARNDKEIFHTKVNLCRLNIIQRKTSNAKRMLDQIENEGRFSIYEDEIKYWRAWIYFFEWKWVEASKIFEELGKKNLYEICISNKDKFYSIEKAKILSMFLPGLGQFYTGNYLSGFGSFLWNTLSAYLTISAFYQDRIFDGVIISNLLWLRFYKGNLENAEKFALEKNNILFEETLDFIYKNYSEEIP
ncbi:MAG: hypothetical protein NZM09_02145 [Ignavibacterium sp.]|nr:hypothetical protein [Ignavibacterium sp.]MDW8374477.1 hypothetical protein [Ignavibacteriales bacterium]